jgi:hypothetical protein
MCARSLEEDLTVTNVTEILKIADLHKCLRLKLRCIDFLGVYILNIKTEDWDKFAEANPELVNEILLEWIKVF